MSTVERELHSRGNPFLYNIPSSLTNEIPHLSVYDLLHTQMKNEWTRDYIGTCKTYYDQKENIKTINGVQAATYRPRIVPYISTEDNSFMLARIDKVNFEVNGVLEPEYDYLMHEMARYLSKLYPDNLNTLTTLTHSERDGYFNEASHMIGSSVDLENYVSVGTDDYEDLYYKYNYVTNYRVLKNTIGSITAPQRFLRLLPTTIDTTSYQVLRNNNNVPFIGSIQANYSTTVASANVFAIGDNRAISSSSVSCTAFDSVTWPSTYMASAEVSAALSDVARLPFLVFTDSSIKEYFKGILVKAVHQAAFTSLADDMTFIRLPQAFNLFNQNYPSDFVSSETDKVQVVPIYQAMNFNHRTLGIAVEDDNSIAKYDSQVRLQDTALVNTGTTFANIDTMPILTLKGLEYTEDIVFLAFVAGIKAAANYVARVISQMAPTSVATMADLCVTLKQGEQDIITMVIDMQKVFGLGATAPLIVSDLSDIIVSDVTLKPSAFSALIETYVKGISHPYWSYSARGKSLNVFSTNIATMAAEVFLIPSNDRNELTHVAQEGYISNGNTFGKAVYVYTAAEVADKVRVESLELGVTGLKNEQSQAYVSMVLQNSLNAMKDYISQSSSDISNHITLYCRDTFTQSAVAVYGLNAPMYTTISKAIVSAQYDSSVEQIVLSEVSFVKVNNVRSIDLAYNGESPDLNYAVAFGFSFNTNEYTKAISAKATISAVDEIIVKNYENEIEAICHTDQYPQFVLKCQDGREAFGKVTGCSRSKEKGLVLTVSSVNLNELYNTLSSFDAVVAFNTYEKTYAQETSGLVNSENKSKYSIRYNGDVIDVCAASNLNLTATVNQNTLEPYQYTWPGDLSTAVFDTNSFIISLTTSSLRDVSDVFNKEESLFLDYSTSPVSIFAKARMQNAISWTVGSNALTKNYTGAIPTTYGLIYDDQITDNYLETYKKKLKDTVEGLGKELDGLGRVDLSSLITTVGYSLILWNYVVWDTYQEKTIKWHNEVNQETGKTEVVYDLLPEQPTLISTSGNNNNTFDINYRTLWSGWLSKFDVKVNEDFFLTNEDILQLPTTVYKTFLISEYNFSNANCLPYDTESNLSVLPYFTSLIPYTKSDIVCASTKPITDSNIPKNFELPFIELDLLAQKAMSVAVVEHMYSYNLGAKSVYFSKSTVDREYIDDMEYGKEHAGEIFRDTAATQGVTISYNSNALLNTTNWVSVVAPSATNTEKGFFENFLNHVELDSYEDEYRWENELVFDEDGNPVMVQTDTQMADTEGNPIFDENGDPVYMVVQQSIKKHPLIRPINFTINNKSRYSIDTAGYTCFDGKKLLSVTGTVCNGFADYAPLKSIPSIVLTCDMAPDDPSGLYEVYTSAASAFSYLLFDMLKWYAQEYYQDGVYADIHNGRSITGLELAYSLPAGLFEGRAKENLAEYFDVYLKHFKTRHPCVPYIIGKNVTTPEESNIYCYVPYVKEVDGKKQFAIDVQVLNMYHRTLLQLCTVGDVLHMNTKENSFFIKRFLYLNSFQMSPSSAIEVTPLTTELSFGNKTTTYRNTQVIDFDGESLQFNDVNNLSVSVPTTAYIKAVNASFKVYTENDNSYEILPCSIKLTDGTAEIGDTSSLVLFDLSEVVLRTSYSVDREIQLVDRTYDVPYSHVYAYKETANGTELILGTNPRNQNTGISNTSLAITPSKPLKNQLLEPTVVPATLHFGKVPSAQLTDVIQKLNYDYIKVKFIATGVMSSDEPGIITIKDDISIAEHIDVGDDIEIIANTVFPALSAGYQSTVEYDTNLIGSTESTTLKVVARHDCIQIEQGSNPYTLLLCTDGQKLYSYEFDLVRCELSKRSELPLRLKIDDSDPVAFNATFDELGNSDGYLSYVLDDPNHSRMILKDATGAVVTSHDINSSTVFSGFSFEYDPVDQVVPHYIIGKSGLTTATIDEETNYWNWQPNELVPESIRLVNTVTDQNYNTISFTNNGLVYYIPTLDLPQLPGAPEASFLKGGEYDKISASDATHEDFIHFIDSEGRDVNRSYSYVDPTDMKTYITEKLYNIFGITDETPYEYDPSIEDTLLTASKAEKKQVTDEDGNTYEETTGAMTLTRIKNEVIKMRLARIVFGLGKEKATVTTALPIYRFVAEEIQIPVVTDYNYGETYTLPMRSWLIKPHTAKVKLEEFNDVNALIDMSKALSSKDYISKPSTVNSSSLTYQDDELYATFDDATASFRIYRKGIDLYEINNKAITELLAFRPYGVDEMAQPEDREELPVRHTPLFYLLDDETKPVTNALHLPLDNFDVAHGTEKYISAAQKIDKDALPSAKVPTTLYDLVFCHKHLLAEPDHEGLIKPDFVASKLKEITDSCQSLADAVENERKNFAISEDLYGDSLSVVFNECLLWLTDATSYIDAVETNEGTLTPNLKMVRDILGTNEQLASSPLFQLLQEYVESMINNRPAVPLVGSACLANGSVKIRDPEDSMLGNFIPMDGTLSAMYSHDADQVISFAHSKGLFRNGSSMYVYGYVEWNNLATLTDILSKRSGKILKDAAGNPIIVNELSVANNIVQAIANYTKVTTGNIIPELNYDKDTDSYSITVKEAKGVDGSGNTVYETIEWVDKRTPFIVKADLSSGSMRILPVAEAGLASINEVFVDGAITHFFGVSEEGKAVEGTIELYDNYVDLVPDRVSNSPISTGDTPKYNFQNNCLALNTVYNAISDITSIQDMHLEDGVENGASVFLPILAITANSLVSSSGDFLKTSKIRRVNGSNKKITLRENLFNPEANAKQIKVIVLVANEYRDNFSTLGKVATATIKRLEEVQQPYMFITPNKDYADFATPMYEMYNPNEPNGNVTTTHMADVGYEAFNNGVEYSYDEDGNITGHTYNIENDTTDLWKYTYNDDGVKLPEIATNDYGRVIYRAEGNLLRVKRTYESYFEDIRNRGDISDLLKVEELVEEFKTGCKNLTPMVALPDDPIAAFNDYTKFLCWSDEEATGTIAPTADRRYVKVTLKDKSFVPMFKELEEKADNHKYSSMVPASVGLDGFTFLTGCALYKFKISVPYRTLTLPKLTPISNVAFSSEGAVHRLNTDMTEVYIPRNGYAQVKDSEYSYPADCYFADGTFYYDGTYEHTWEENGYVKTAKLKGGATLNENDIVMTVVDVDTMEPTTKHLPALAFESFAAADSELPVRLAGINLVESLSRKDKNLYSLMNSKLIDLGHGHKGIKINVGNGTWYNNAITYLKESLLPLPYDVFKAGIEFSAKVYSSSAVDSYKNTKDLYQIAITSEGANQNLVKPSRVLVTRSKQDDTPLLPTTKFWNNTKMKSEYYFSTIPSLNSALACDEEGHTLVMHTNGVPEVDDQPDNSSRIKGVNYKAITRQAFNTQLATNKLTTTRITSNSDRYSIGGQLSSLKLSYFKSALKESTDSAVLYSVEYTSDTNEAIAKSMSLASLYRYDNSTDPTMDIYYTDPFSSTGSTQVFCDKIVVSDMVQIRSYVPASTEGDKKVKAIIFYDANGNMVSQTVYLNPVPIKATFVCTTI